MSLSARPRRSWTSEGECACSSATRSCRPGREPLLARIAQPAKLFRRGSDAPVALDPLQKPPSCGEADHLVKRVVDRLRECPRAKNLLRLGHLLSIDDQRSLVRFGYLLCHVEISYRGGCSAQKEGSDPEGLTLG